MSRSMRLLIVSVVILMAIAAGLAGAALAGGSTPTTPSTQGRQEGITVQGQGKSEGTPDVLRLSLSVDVIKSTIQDALDSSNSAVSKVIAALRQNGVAQKDIQTTGLSIDRAYAYPRNAAPRFRGYQVGNSIQVKIRDLKNAGKTISASATAAGNAVRIDGISFDLQDNVALLKSARDSAMADAKTKAEQYASDSGRRLGKVVLITEQQQPSYPVPVFAGAVNAAPSIAGPAAVPISAGVQQVTVTVTVVYEFA
jgi:uncharacterized protein YggE